MSGTQKDPCPPPPTPVPSLDLAYLQVLEKKAIDNVMFEHRIFDRQAYIMAIVFTPDQTGVQAIIRCAATDSNIQGASKLAGASKWYKYDDDGTWERKLNSILAAHINLVEATGKKTAELLRIMKMPTIHDPSECNTQ